MNYKFIKYNILYLRGLVGFIFLISFKSHNNITQMISVSLLKLKNYVIFPDETRAENTLPQTCQRNVFKITPDLTFYNHKLLNFIFCYCTGQSPTKQE